MAQKLQIVPAKAALCALLVQGLGDLFDEKVDVKETGKKDFNDAGELVLPKVAVRVRFGQAEYSMVRDTTKTTLSAALAFQVICRHESLRGANEQRDRSLELVGCVQEIVAGARLLLPDGTISEPIGLLGVFAVEDKGGPVENCYGVSIKVPGYSQFDGTYASGVGVDQEAAA